MLSSNSSPELISVPMQPSFPTGDAEQIIVPHRQIGIQTFRHSIDIYLRKH